MIELIVLRLIHVLGGIFWVGSAVFNGLFLMPVVGGLGPQGGAVMKGLQDRKMMVFLPVVAILTILSGLRLIWIASGGFDATYFGTGPGAAYAGAGGLAILTFVLGMTMARPMGERMGQLGAQLAQAKDEPTRARLGADLALVRQRMATVGTVITIMLVVAAAGMAVGRYL